MSPVLLPLARVKALLGLPAEDDPVNDPKLTAALPVITELFEHYCKRGLAFVADVEEEISPATARLKLFRYPLDEDALAVEIEGVNVVTPYRVDEKRGFVELGYAYGYPCFPYQVARITYSGGYPEAEVPADLADAFARCCADYAGVSYSIGGGSGSGGGAPLKSLGLGSGALTVSFDTATQAQSSYDTSSVPPILASYLYALDHYRLKDFV